MSDEGQRAPQKALEDLLARGTRGIDSKELERVLELLEGENRAKHAELIRKIVAEQEPPERLVNVLDATRREVVANLAPPIVTSTVRGKRRKALLKSINLEAGGTVSPPLPKGHALEQLAALPAHRAVEPIQRVTDVPLLWCLVRSGRIAERRAAVRRLGTLVSEGVLGDEGFDEKDLVSGLASVRDPRVAFEVDRALASVAGSAGRAARQRLARADKLLNKVRQGSRRYWTGEEAMDPLDELTREESLRLGVWLCRGPDELAAHVAEYLQLQLGRGDPAKLADAVGAFIPSGDERLVPVLYRILSDGPLAARIATARALARIADPRVHKALVKAYRHATDVTEKTVIGGALGQYGDDRALSFLIERLEKDEPLLWEETVRSLGSIGDDEAAPRLLPLLRSDQPALLRAAASSLIRCGGPSAYTVLRGMARKRPQRAALLNNAAEALGLRLQLLGLLPKDAAMLPPSRSLLSHREDEGLAPAEAPIGPPFDARLKSLGYYLLGLFWATLWQRDRALDAFGAAARIHRGAPTPHLREALVHASNSRDDLAIESFRRALRANKPWVLRRQNWVEHMMRSFLRRADHLVARRRKREALALLDEIAALDLNVADLDIRLAITRRRDRLLVDRSRRRLTQIPHSKLQSPGARSQADSEV